MADCSSAANRTPPFLDGESAPNGAEDRRSVSTPRLLCVREQEPSWVSLTLGLNSAGLGPPRLLWVSSPRDALSRLRDEQFDCILVDVPAAASSSRDENGPFGLILAMRTAGCQEPVVIVARLFTNSDWAQASALDCDVFVSPGGWDLPALGGMVKRAILRGELVRENHQLATANHRRLLRERDESEQLLAQQRKIIAEIEALPDRPREPPAGLPSNADRAHDARSAPTEIARSSSEFAARYAALLRSYVLMGSGSLAVEIAEMADGFVSARIPPPEALQLHLHCVEGLLSGLGTRSARHVVARADLLAVEMMTHLAHRSQRVADALGTTSLRNKAPSPVRNVTGTAGIDLAEGPQHLA